MHINKTIWLILFLILFMNQNLGQGKNNNMNTMNNLNKQKFLPNSSKIWAENLGTDVIIYDVGGSTNTIAYQLIINRNGDVLYHYQPKFDNDIKTMSFKADNSQINDLFSILETLWPFPSSKNEHMVKSVSFGHYAYITYNGIHSSDLDTYSNNAPITNFINKLNCLIPQKN